MNLFAGTEFYIPPRCERCQKLEEDCECPPEVPVKQVLPPEEQTATIRVEKRKRGKTVTVISGLSPEENHLDELLTQLKNTCGSGGTIKDGKMEIQGNRQLQIENVLRKIGFKIKGQ